VQFFYLKNHTNFHLFLNFCAAIPKPKNTSFGVLQSSTPTIIRFIKQNHLLVNSQYPDEFKDKLHSLLKDRGFKTTELQVKENTKYAWGYINFLHLDGLIILPAIDKTNDTYVKMQLQDLYPNTIIELCDAKPLLKKGGVFNCISWEL
jgi:agmatine/peptidylarginine deiminase